MTVIPSLPEMAFFISLGLKSTILVLLGLGITRWMGGNGAHRHVVWLGIFGALLLLPLALWMGPYWALEIPHKTAWLAPSSPLSEALPLGVQPHLNETLTNPPNLLSWLPLMVWALGFGWGLALLLRDLMAGRQLFRAATRINCARLNATVGEIAREMGLSPPRLLETAKASVPMVWGPPRRAIVLPAYHPQWQAEQLRAVLLHEMAHLRRGDFLTANAARLIAVVYWFNPLVWLALHRLRGEQEHACDARVLESGTRPTLYARLMLDMLRRLKQPGNRAAVSMLGGRVVEKRLQNLLHDHVNQLGKGLRRKMFLPLTAGAMAVLLVLVIRPMAVSSANEAPESKLAVPLMADSLPLLGQDGLESEPPSGSEPAGSISEPLSLPEAGGRVAEVDSSQRPDPRAEGQEPIRMSEVGSLSNAPLQPVDGSVHPLEVQRGREELARLVKGLLGQPRKAGNDKTLWPGLPFRGPDDEVIVIERVIIH